MFDGVHIGLRKYLNYQSQAKHLPWSHSIKIMSLKLNVLQKLLYTYKQIVLAHLMIHIYFVHHGH